MVKPWVVAILTSASLASVASCGADVARNGSGGADERSPSAAVERAPSSDLLLARSYESFSELREDSVAAVVGTVEGTRPGPVAGGDGETMTETISTLRVVEVPWGDQMPSTLDVVQLGGAREITEAGPVMRPGETYFLFVTPSALPDVYSVTGTDTGYRLDPTRAAFLAETQRPSGLPTQIAQAGLSEVITGP